MTLKYCSVNSLDFDKKFLAFVLSGDMVQVAHYNLTGSMLQLPVSGDGNSSLTACKCQIYYTWLV